MGDMRRWDEDEMSDFIGGALGNTRNGLGGAAGSRWESRTDPTHSEKKDPPMTAMTPVSTTSSATSAIQNKVLMALRSERDANEKKLATLQAQAAAISDEIEERRVRAKAMEDAMAIVKVALGM